MLQDFLESSRESKTLISDVMIRTKAKEAAKMMNIGEDKFKASAGWVENFKHRHGIRKGVWEGKNTEITILPPSDQNDDDKMDLPQPRVSRPSRSAENENIEMDKFVPQLSQLSPLGSQPSSNPPNTAHLRLQGAPSVTRVLTRRQARALQQQTTQSDLDVAMHGDDIFDTTAQNQLLDDVRVHYPSPTFSPSLTAVTYAYIRSS